MIKIFFNETLGIDRIKEPVTFGVVFPCGKMSGKFGFTMADEKGNIICHDYQVLATWYDDSLKWVLFDIQLSIGARDSLGLTISEETHGEKNSLFSDFSIKSDQNQIVVNTGKTLFSIGIKEGLHLFKWIEFPSTKIFLSKQDPFCLTDTEDRLWFPTVENWSVEHDTKMRKVLYVSGRFKQADHYLPVEFNTRLYFYAEKSQVKIDFTLVNPKPALHEGGAWDLGDPNSFFFKDLSFALEPEDQKINGCYLPDITEDRSMIETLSDMRIYQDSSGKKNWDSKNHYNREKQIPLSFKGYKVYENQIQIDTGFIASPIMGASTREFHVSFFLKDFWQNFPKAMELCKNKLVIRLFPLYFKGGFELQPGEQKRHTLYFDITTDVSKNFNLNWAQDPLIPIISNTDWYEGMTRPRPVPESYGPYEQLANLAIEGDNTFEKKNEDIDEYGWRNFGDVFADHESVLTGDTRNFISHYNNQYDVIKGLILQFMRSGNAHWFTLARNMADHLVDIDMYHTDKDKFQFNGGLFWHTDHHLDASTSTHRTISRDHRDQKPRGAFGGGPAPDHNYSTGLLFLYWMTGDPVYKDAVLSLSSNIINCMEGPDTLGELLFVLLKQGYKGVRSHISGSGNQFDDVFRFNGPGRASGNSLNTLIDAWLLTNDVLYLHQAQKLIHLCVSIEDDLDEMDLLNSEKRWMYTIFLQALGRYLDTKKSMNQFDSHFFQARDIFCNYAAWMEKKEYPYLSKPDDLEFPTETWAAQDIRKADIFAIAATYAPEALTEKFMEKSSFFFEHALQELSSFDTKTFTRPMAIVLTNGMASMEMRYHAVNGTLPKGAGPYPPLPGLPGFFPTLWKRVKNFSLEKEINWIKIQLRSQVKK